MVAVVTLLIGTSKMAEGLWGPTESVAKRVLVVAFLDVRHHSRTLRQVEALVSRFEHVTLLAFGAFGPSIPGLTYFDLTTKHQSAPFNHRKFSGLSRFFRALLVVLHLDPLVVGRLDPAVQKALGLLGEDFFDVVVANEPETLPLAFELANGSPVVVDLHDWGPGHFEPNSVQSYVYGRHKLWLLRSFLHRCSAITTGGEVVAKRWEEEFGVLVDAIVLNAPQYRAVSNQETQSPIRLSYHGLFGTSRGIFSVLRLLPKLWDKYEFHLTIHGPGADQILAYSKFLGVESKVFIHDAVAPEDIVSHLAQFDCSLVFIEPSNENNLLTNPGKFYESIHARLPVIVGPSPELAHLVSQFGLGWVSRDFTDAALAEVLDSITLEGLRHRRNNCAKAAKALSWEVSRNSLIQVVEKVARAKSHNQEDWRH